jgi:hypothetical protein
MKHEYHLESFALGKWLKILQGSLQYCQGFLDARKDYAPRNAYRLMRSDGRVMEDVPARDDVNIGQIAGWPSAEQYESAANKALERAKAIRERANAEPHAEARSADSVQADVGSSESKGGEA